MLRGIFLSKAGLAMLAEDNGNWRALDEEVEQVATS